MMLFECWTFREKLNFLSEWKEVLVEQDADRLKLTLLEIKKQAVEGKQAAYAETADALLEHFELIPPLQKRLRKGSDLSEISFSAVLRGQTS
ncbi:MAG: hypothetical protein K6D90_09205 [Lachnospiraceae bacterium]|nr:hypothetical protein [Lachnospiraceae bacterium]